MQYTLGLDLGSASLGWAVLKHSDNAESDQKPQIVRTGVRIFDAGVEGVIEQGKDSSRAAKRREARQPRRLLWRRQHRKRKLFRQLQRFGLLPQSESDDATSRKELFDQLDAELRAEYLPNGTHAEHQKLPYLLRSMAVQVPLPPYALGRAIYSLAQRRGFLSNRKADTADTEDGIVKAAVSELSQALGDRTLGQFFAEDIDPESEELTRRNIRRRYTARNMFHDEFRRIRETQSAHTSLSNEQWDQLFKTIFFQRPLKSQRHRIGRCEIDGRPRCLDALDAFQQFRIWQTVQNLRIADARMYGRDERLSLEEQRILVDALQSREKLTWKQARKLLGLKNKNRFTVEEWSKDKGLKGHVTNARMIAVFGEAWLQRSVEQRDAIVRDVVYFRRPEALRKRAVRAWGLTEEQAAELVSVRLEEGHARHSARTLAVFVEHMQRGEDYSTIRQRLTGKDDAVPMDLLPPIANSGLDITNPAVIRALTELRKVVNELIREFGKPTLIRIELARDLKNSRDHRRKIHQNNEDRRKRRERAIEGILKEMPGLKYSGADIEKWLLAEECGWECPYTGKRITPARLFGPQPEFDVEHILPRRFLDNSFSNKTLCDSQFNRSVKRDQTAFDACSKRNDWDEIVARVAAFDGPVAALKRRKFLTSAKDIPDDFTTRHLNDTRYNAVVARRYLAMLYGGLADAEGVQRVFAVTGSHTAILRRYWGLNSVLGETDEKSRDDQRHHAIDAIVVALTDPGRIQALVRAAEQADRIKSRRFYEAIQDPWPAFADDVTQAVRAIVVSYRPTRTISGAMHAETLYSKPIEGPDGNPAYRVRKHLTKLSVTDITRERIVDPGIRRLVTEKLAELGQRDPAKAFADETNHPFLTTRDGRRIPIHKVRIYADKKARPIAKGPRTRFVASGKDSNFASMIYAELDEDGNETRWVHKVITRLEAYERKAQNHRAKGEKIFLPSPTDFDDDKPRIFKFALCKNDAVALMGPDGQDVYYRIQKLSINEIQLCELTMPTVKNNQRTPDNRITSIDRLRTRKLRRVSISPAGVVRFATD